MPPSAPKPDTSVRRLYVGNIHFSTSSEDLLAFFVKHKVSARVKHMSQPVQPEHKNAGYAFITVLGADQEGLALALNDNEGPKGRKGMKVRQALPKSKPVEVELPTE